MSEQTLWRTILFWFLLIAFLLVALVLVRACGSPRKQRAVVAEVFSSSPPTTAPAPTTTVMPVPTTVPTTTVTRPMTTTTTTEPPSEPDHQDRPFDPDGKPWPAPTDADWGIWMAMAQCETGGAWHTIKPKFQGGLGMYKGTWSSYGGNILGIANAGNATIEEQIWVARRVRDAHGYSAWGCAAAIGVG